MLTRHDVGKALLEQVAKDSPTVNQVHVPGIMGAAAKPKGKNRLQRMRERRGELAKAIAKSNGDTTPEEKVGTYVGRLVVNPDALASWWASARVDGEPDALDPNSHLTVAYSRAVFTWDDDATGILLDPSCYLGFKVLGPDKAVVLRVNSPVLESRWKDALAAGATWDHDGYEPHVTLFYLGAEYDSNDWRDGSHPAVPDFAIQLGCELRGPRGSDVFTPATPDWYVAS
jgi:hypothetical protein